MTPLRDPLLRGWVALVVFSVATTLLAMAVARNWIQPSAAPLAGAAILALAWAKARVILRRYLGLAEAPSWRRGFDLVLGLFVLGLLALYAGPALI